MLVSLAEVKQYLRVTFEDDDALLEQLLRDVGHPFAQGLDLLLHLTFHQLALFLHPPFSLLLYFLQPLVGLLPELFKPDFGFAVLLVQVVGAFPCFLLHLFAYEFHLLGSCRQTDAERLALADNHVRLPVAEKPGGNGSYE